MERVSLRLPRDVIRAFDSASGNRSAVMRRVLTDAVAEGEVAAVPPDLMALAEREAAVDRGRLARKRGTFKRRVYDWYADKWRSGAVTAADAEDLAVSWRHEAALYGEEALAYLDAILDWYRESWDPADRPDWPDPGMFMARADPESVEVEERLVETAREGRERGLSAPEVRERLRSFHDDSLVEAAVTRAFADGETDPEPEVPDP